MVANLTATAPDPQTVVITTSVPDPEAADDGRLHPAEAHLGQDERGRARKYNGAGRRRLGPVRARRSSRRASSRASRRTRTTGAASPRSTRSCSACSTTRDAMVAALKTGRARRRPGHPGERVQPAQERRQHRDDRGLSGRLQRDRDQRRRRPEEAAPGAARPEGAQGDRARDRQADDRRPRARRPRHARETISPSPNPNWIPEIPARTSCSSSISPRPTRSSTTPATRTPTATAFARCPDGGEPLNLTYMVRSDGETGAEDRRVRHAAGSRRSASARRRRSPTTAELTDDHRQGRLRHVRVGLDAVRRPGPDALVLHLQPDREPIPDDPTNYYNDANWCDPEYDKLYKQQNVELDPREAPRDRARDAHALQAVGRLQRALHRAGHAGLPRRIASPAGSSSRPRSGPCCSPTPRRPTRG